MTEYTRNSDNVMRRIYEAERSKCNFEESVLPL